jgi:hypothetical protein
VNHRDFLGVVVASLRKRTREKEVEGAVTAAVADGNAGFSEILSHIHYNFSWGVESPEVWAALERLELRGVLQRVKGNRGKTKVQTWVLFDWTAAP